MVNCITGRSEQIRASSFLLQLLDGHSTLVSCGLFMPQCCACEMIKQLCMNTCLMAKSLCKAEPWYPQYRDEHLLLITTLVNATACCTGMLCTVPCVTQTTPNYRQTSAACPACSLITEVLPGLLLGPAPPHSNMMPATSASAAYCSTC